MFRWAVVTAAFLASPIDLLAQPDPTRPAGTLFGEEKRAVDEIAAADRLAGEQKWSDAVRRFQQVLVEFGDMLVPVGDGRSLPARWVVHQKLATMNPVGRQFFRDQVATSARKLLVQGISGRDSAILERVVAAAFCSRAGEEALHGLGDLAFERGEFESADRWWRLIARPASREEPGAAADKSAFELVYPDPTDGGALARAKQILAMLFLGARDQARSELTAFQKKHASAEGTLAGRKGKYADLLQEFLSSARLAGLAPMRGGPATWPTFAGDASRNSVVAGESTPYWPDTPSWRITLPGDPLGRPHRDSDPPPGTGSAARSLAFHPAIAAGHVFVADASRVFAFSATTGKLVREFNFARDNKMPDGLDLRLPSRTDARYTLTVDGNRIYARFGAQPMKPAEANKPHEMDSALVCLELVPDPKGEIDLRFRWQIRARTVDTEPASLFEGAPIVADGRLYVARTRFEGRQSIASVECYDADAPDGRNESPPMQWKQDLWSTELTGPTDTVRHRHDVLTRAGPYLVHCTHSGAIVALDAATGKRAWAVRYPVVTAKPFDGTLPRDLCPCLFSRGRLFAAPADSDRIFCLDALSGEKIWESAPVHLVQLLGASGNRLFVTLGGYPQGIRCYNAGNGNVNWSKPDEGDRATFGRGLIAGSWVLWPTRFGLKVLRLDDGEPEDAGSSTEPWGNLALGDGVLVVATPTELWGFVPERKYLERPASEDAPRPDTAIFHLRTGVARADAGEMDEAIREFQKTISAADAGDFLRQRTVREIALERCHQVLLDRADQYIRREETDQATRRLREAANEPFSWNDRLRAMALLKRLNATQLPAVQSLPKLRSEWVTQSDGIPRRADEWLALELGRDTLNEWDEPATQLEKSDFDAAAISFQWHRGIRTEAQQRAQKAEMANEPARAMTAFRQLLAAADWDDNVKRAAEDRRIARAGLARMYNQLGFTAAAQSLLWQIEQDQPPRDPKKRPSAPVSRATGDLARMRSLAWNVALDPLREAPLRPFRDGATGEFAYTADSDGRIFFSRGREIVCRSIHSGGTHWSTAIDHDADSFTYHAETLLVAGRQGISRIRRRDGSVLWTIHAADPRPMPGPSSTPRWHGWEHHQETLPFSAFRLAGSRLIFLSGNERLLALDVETGRIIWQYKPAGVPLLGPVDGVAISEHFFANHDAVLLQTGTGKAVGLDAVHGRVVFQFNAPALWTSPPVQGDANCAVCSTDGEHLAAINLATGIEVWNHALEGVTGLSGAALQVRIVGSQLLVRIERNYGFEWELRATVSGQRQMPAMFLGAEAGDLFDAGITDRAVYLATSRRLVGFSLQTAERLWSVALPQSGSWRVQASPTGLLVYVREAIPEVDVEQMSNLAVREIGIIPTVASMHTAAAMLYHAMMRRSAPVLLIDPATGKTRQNFQFASKGSNSAVLLDEQDIAIAVQDRLYGLAPSTRD